MHLAGRAQSDEVKREQGEGAIFQVGDPHFLLPYPFLTKTQAPPPYRVAPPITTKRPLLSPATRCPQ